MGLTLTIDNLSLTDQGFLVDCHLWNERVALVLAKQEGIVLTPDHWELLFFIREYYQRYKHLPNMRVFVRAVRNSLGEEKGCSRYLHHLFPDGPLKYSCKLAGLPKPPTCI